MLVDVRVRDEDVDAGGAEDGGGADAGELEELGGLDGAGGKEDFFF